MRATGRLHLGNYLGALRQWVAAQDAGDNYFFIADLHGLTNVLDNHDPIAFKKSRLMTAATFLGAGLEPERCTLFLQSAVAQHTELMWYLSGVAKKSELERMTQWKDKKSKGGGSTSALFAYPVLMAADILLYDADEVPVGDDQRQHVEVARDWALRFNHHFGETFVVPRAVVPEEGARVMDLSEPTSKMSKSSRGDDGVVYLDDSDDAIRKKVRRAVTDSAGVVAPDSERPGISNLVGLYSTLSGHSQELITEEYSGRGYGEFKNDLADLVIAAVAPVRNRTVELMSDHSELERLLGLGTDRAIGVAQETCRRVASKLGLGALH